MKVNLNWTGWDEDSNAHGEEFDFAARQRMVEGGQLLKPHILEHVSLSKELNILEIGPFFNPLILPQEFPSCNILYWERDKYALNWLNQEICKSLHSKGNALALQCDLDLCSKPSFLDSTQKWFNINKLGEVVFDVIVISQVFNYIDYRELLILVEKKIKPKGFLFVNNIPDYGLPKFFSEKRPQSNKEVVTTLIDLGFYIHNKEIVPLQYDDNNLERLLLSLQKNTSISKVEKLLTSYKKNISKEGGFLPDKIPDCDLPIDFEKYVDAVNSLHFYYTSQDKGVRTWMAEIFKSYDEQLNSRINQLSFWEKNKLLTIVTILCHTYRWDYLPAIKKRYEETEVELPIGLEKPLCLLTKLLDQPSCGSLWNTTICNWKIKEKKGCHSYSNKDLSMSNLEIAHTWFDNDLHEQLKKWILIFVVSEAKGASIIRSLVYLIKYCNANDELKVITEFQLLNNNLGELVRFFNKQIQFKKLDVNQWRVWVQPTFIWGLKSKEGELLEGASGLQLGVTQCLDIALGIKNESKIGTALKNSRKFMPPFHRNFLNDLEACQDIILEYVRQSKSPVVKNEFNRSISMLLKFRHSHKRRGEAYIKGDDSKKTMTTTGLSIIAKDSYLVKEFQMLMDERINDTHKVHVF